MMALKDEQDEEQQAFLPSSPAHQVILLPKNDSALNPRRYLRLILECTMAVIIAALVLRPLPAAKETDKPSPVPNFPRKTYTFLQDSKYLHEDMFSSREETLHTLHNWIELSAYARGYVQIADASSFDLLEPYIVQVNLTNTGPAYMMSVFHQLHCLSYIVQHYQQGFSGVELTQEVAQHSAHCFDYLRQSIMCAADTSLEGKTEAGPGWGSVHQCKDYDAVLTWANKHGAARFRGNMPDEAVL